MMETKIWTGLCVLLLIHWGSADDKQQPASTEIALSGEGHQVPAASAIPASGHQPANHTVSAVKGSDTNTTSNGTSSLSSSTTTSFAPKVKKDNDTSIISPSVSVTTENATKTEEFASPPVLPTESQTSLSVTTTASTTTTTKSPSHTPHNASVDIPATSTSNYSQPPDSISPSMQPTRPKTDPSTSTTTITTAITTTQPSSTSTSSEAQTPTLQNKPTATVTPSSTSTEAKACSENPSPLNVGVNTKMVHDSPALDPLLAGLVSAFIITAVIITLLLFLKLRRRDNQPEFRRLQDLPMDDMMEDTPLSMYSY